MSAAAPTFSFVVPVYNVEQYLSKCIESVLGQACLDFELILVDDGSTDSSGKICDSYQEKDERICVIHKTNAGVSAARNLGIEQARGEYICFIDSDDWIESNYLSEIKAEIANFDILFFGCVWHYEDGSVRSLCPPAAECQTDIYDAVSILLQNDMKVNYFGFTWNNVFRRDIIAQHHIRFVEHLPVSEDEVFTLAYCNHAKTLKVVPSPLYHYLWKQQGLTHKDKTPEEWRLLADSFLQLLDGIDNEALADSYKRRIANYYNMAAWSSQNVYGWLKNECRMFGYCRQNHIAIPYKSVAKELIYKMIR